MTNFDTKRTYCYLARNKQCGLITTWQQILQPIIEVYTAVLLEVQRVNCNHGVPWDCTYISGKGALLLLHINHLSFRFCPPESAADF